MCRGAPQERGPGTLSLFGKLRLRAVNLTIVVFSNRENYAVLLRGLNGLRRGFGGGRPPIINLIIQ